MDRNDTNSFNSPTKAISGSARKKQRARPSGTAFEKALMPGFTALLQKRATQSVTYQEVKNEYGPAIRAAIDAGVCMDEFVAIYSAHKEQVTGQPLSPDQTFHIKAGYKQLRDDWMHGKLKGRKTTAFGNEPAKPVAPVQGIVSAATNNRPADRPTNPPVDLAADDLKDEEELTALVNNTPARTTHVTQTASPPSVPAAIQQTNTGDRLDSLITNFQSRT
jgi:hypothetical protein